MARFRKIDPRIWNDEKFRELSDQAKLLFLFLLTHPHLTALGAMRANQAGLAHELNWSFETVSKRFAELFRNGLLEYDETASFLAVVNFLKYNLPDNPNVVKGWEKALDLIPECDLKLALVERVKTVTQTLPEEFRKGLPNCFETVSKPFRTQEQEQEQENITGAGSSSSSSGSNFAREAPKKNSSSTTTRQPASAFILTEELRHWAEGAAPEIDPEAEAEKFVDHYARDGTTFADLPAAFRKWMRDAIVRSRSPARRESAGEHNNRIFREIEAEEQARQS